MKTETIVCATCGAESEKRAAELKRQRKKGRTKFYCNLSCYGSSPEVTTRIVENRGDYDISQHAGNARDEFTPFRPHLRRAKKRKKHGPCNLTLEHLRDLWTGKCVVTGLPITLPEWNDGKSDMRTTASLDRIDSSKGYVIGNVQWVSGCINLAKQDMTNEQIVEWVQWIRSGD